MAKGNNPKAAGKGGGKAGATGSKPAGPKPQGGKGQAQAKPAAPAAASKPAAPAAAPAPAPSTPAVELAAPQPRPRGFRRKLVGRVTSDKMNKTVVVEVIRNALDPVYKKYVRRRDRYKAHDETNQYKVGDRVEIQEAAPISREKRWTVTRLVTRSVEA